MAYSRKREFYVYALLDERKPGKHRHGDYIFPFEPFYIGKGRGGRVSHHVYLASYSVGTNKHKINKIRKIQSEGFSVVECIVEENKTEKQAFMLEILMIKTIGRYDLKLGPLTNLTDGGEGNTGYVASDVTKNRIRKAKLGTTMPEGFVEKRLVSMSNRSEADKAKTTKKKSQSMRDYHANLSAKKRKSMYDKVSASKKGHEVSEETRAKISASLKGRPCSEARRQKLIGRVVPQETIDKISATLTGRKRKPFSEETKRKMSESARNRRS